MPDIYIYYGTDAVNDTRKLLDASDILRYLKPGMRVAIKPNLVLARQADSGATTHPCVVEGIILFLKDYGISDISIIESSWVGDSTKKAYKACGYEQLSRSYNVPLYDLKNDKCVTKSTEPYWHEPLKICSRALDTDFLINVPVLKAHCQTLMTCCMKNLKGIIPDSEKRRYHTMGIHKPVAALNMVVPTGYCVVDGICGDLTFEEGGTPVQSGRLLAGRDPLTVDSYCARLIGYAPDEIDYINTVCKMRGLSSCEPNEVIELNKGSACPADAAEQNRIVRRYLSKFDICEDSACSACYSSLVYALHRVSGKAVRHNEKIFIGQGLRGRKDDVNIGIGNCCSGFKRYIKGCPPSAADIVGALSEVDALND